jgi:hypothetical protein
MPSVADECWRLSADCSHWAEETRDNAARLAFRQMATAWAGLAFSQDFVLPTDEQTRPTAEISEVASVENIVSSRNITSSDMENEQIGPIRNTEVEVESHKKTTRAETNNSSAQREFGVGRNDQTSCALPNNSSGQRERLSLPSPIPFPKRQSCRAHMAAMAVATTIAPCLSDRVGALRPESWTVFG